jgi:hypothetical protein
MRLKLDDLHPQEVNYEAIPFGFDQKGTGIYSTQNGKRFYLGVQSWLHDCKAKLTFLTTEALISNVLIEAYDKLGRREPITLDLSARCDLFPIKVPLFIDRRATERKITALVDELLSANPNAVVIANSVKKESPEIKTFQRAKGLNGLNENDIFIVVTCLCPDQYAKLNVVGQWLDLPGIIGQYYEDQISQAVGRNTGFRKSEKPTRTVLLCSNRLVKSVLKSCFQDASARVRLQSRRRMPSAYAS